MPGEGGPVKVIIAGDFNCTPDDNEIRSLVKRSEAGIVLTDLSEDNAASGSGTYRYRGTWEMIDQVIVSKPLLSCRKGLFTSGDMFKVFSPAFLLRKDPNIRG